MDISENIINKKIQFNFKGFFSKRLLIYSFLMFSFLTIFLQTKNKVNFFGFAIKNWKVVDLTSQQTVHGYVIKDNDANYPKTSGVDGVWIRAALTLKNGGGTRNIDVVTSTCNGDSTCFCDRGQRCAGHFTFSYDANETQSIEVSTLSLPSGYSSSTAKYPECCFTRYYAGCRIDPRCGVDSYTKVRLPTPAVPLLAPLTFFIHNDSVVGPTPTPIQQSCGNSIKNEDNVDEASYEIPLNAKSGYFDFAYKSGLEYARYEIFYQGKMIYTTNPSDFADSLNGVQSRGLVKLALNPFAFPTPAGAPNPPLIVKAKKRQAGKINFMVSCLTPTPPQNRLALSLTNANSSGSEADRQQSITKDLINGIDAFSEGVVGQTPVSYVYNKKDYFLPDEMTMGLWIKPDLRTGKYLISYYSAFETITDSGIIAVNNFIYSLGLVPETAITLPADYLPRLTTGGSPACPGTDVIDESHPNKYPVFVAKTGEGPNDYLYLKSSEPINTGGSWNYVALTKKRIGLDPIQYTYTIYLNGQSVGSIVAGDIIRTPENRHNVLTIGSYYSCRQDPHTPYKWNDFYPVSKGWPSFSGLMQDVAIYKSAVDISSEYNSQHLKCPSKLDEMLSFWQLNGDFEDSSGKNVNLTNFADEPLEGDPLVTFREGRNGQTDWSCPVLRNIAGSNSDVQSGLKLPENNDGGVDIGKYTVADYLRIKGIPPVYPIPTVAPLSLLTKERQPNIGTIEAVVIPEASSKQHIFVAASLMGDNDLNYSGLGERLYGINYSLALSKRFFPPIDEQPQPPSTPLIVQIPDDRNLNPSEAVYPTFFIRKTPVRDGAGWWELERKYYVIQSRTPIRKKGRDPIYLAVTLEPTGDLVVINLFVNGERSATTETIINKSDIFVDPRVPNGYGREIEAYYLGGFDGMDNLRKLPETYNGSFIGTVTQLRISKNIRPISTGYYKTEFLNHCPAMDENTWGYWNFNGDLKDRSSNHFDFGKVGGRIEKLNYPSCTNCQAADYDGNGSVTQEDINNLYTPGGASKCYYSWNNPTCNNYDLTFNNFIDSQDYARARIDCLVR